MTTEIRDPNGEIRRNSERRSSQADHAQPPSSEIRLRPLFNHRSEFVIRIAEDRLAQTDFDGLEIAHSLGLPLCFD